jgi:hypothetical protein
MSGALPPSNFFGLEVHWSIIEGIYIVLAFPGGKETLIGKYHHPELAVKAANQWFDENFR